MALAIRINEEEYKNEGQLIECEICMDEFSFESMVQVILTFRRYLPTKCADGHLFCSDCVKNWIQETVYGNAKAKLTCLNQDCEVIV